jgi:hypothetical protein
VHALKADRLEDVDYRGAELVAGQDRIGRDE